RDEGAFARGRMPGGWLAHQARRSAAMLDFGEPQGSPLPLHRGPCQWTDGRDSLLVGKRRGLHHRVGRPSIFGVSPGVQDSMNASAKRFDPETPPVIRVAAG